LPDFRKFTEAQIQSYIDYHRPKHGSGSPEYEAALEERERRQGAGLSFRKTYEAISIAAAEGRYVSYGEVAEHSGLSWKVARRPMPRHLGNLCEFAHQKGWPLLSSIVVNKENLTTGELEPQSLAGFVKAARDLGYLVTDERAFLRDQQRRTFEWGKRRKHAG
jgi:hypothetical protein